VSVIVRSLDRPFLRAALASVATQTWPAIEVVVVAAKPGHAALPALPAESGDLELRLLDTDVPRPRSRAANAGLDAARGQYLLFLDDDDWLMPGHIERLVSTLQTHPGSLAAYTGVSLVDADERPFGQAFDYPFDAVRQLAGNMTPIHAVLFDARLLERGCRFDEGLDRYEDWDFWLQLARQTVFVHLPGVSAVYRIHPSSGVHEDSGAQSLSSARIYAKWEPTWGPDQIGEVMRRVWSHNDLEVQLELSEQRRAEARQVADAAVAQISKVNERVDGLRPAIDSLSPAIDSLRPAIDGVQQVLGEQQALLHLQAQEQALRIEHVGRQVEGHAGSLNQQLAELQGQLNIQQQEQARFVAQQQVQAERQAHVLGQQKLLADQQTQALQLLAQVQADTGVLEQHRAEQHAAQAQLSAAQVQLASDVTALTLQERNLAEQQRQRTEEHAQALAAQFSALVAEHAQARAVLDQRLADQAATLAQLSQTLAVQIEREARLSRELQAVLGSTSWRITKPVRALIDALAGLFRRGGHR
jgi:hypothetical protein